MPTAVGSRTTRLLLSRVRGRHAISPTLREELERTPLWMYPWRLAPGVTPPLHNPMFPSIHATRDEMIEGPVRDSLTLAGPEATAIDLACNEGWCSHRMLEWGASRVVGVDLREVNIRRARLLAEHFGIGAERLTLHQLDVFDIDAAELGTFDVVLNLGLIYHVENPVGALRISHALCRGLCVIETQLTRQSAPLEWGAGPGASELAPGSFATYLETDADVNPLASAVGLLSLIPNRAAVEEMALAAGFDSVEMVEPPAGAEGRYASLDRGVFLARV